MTSPPTGLDRRLHTAAWLLAGLTVLGALATLWLPPLLPCADAPNHLLGVQVHRTPERFAGLLQPNLPVTALGFIGPMLLVPSWIDLHTSARLVHTLWLLVALVGALRIARWAGTSVPMALVGGAWIALGWTWAMGFWNYTASIALGLVAASFHVRATRARSLAGAAASLLHALAGAAHLPGAVVFAAWAVWLRALHAGPPRSALATLPRSALLLAPLVIVGGAGLWAASVAETNLGSIRLGGWAWVPWAERPWAFFTLAAHHFSSAGPWVAAAALLAALAAAWRDARRGAECQAGATEAREAEDPRAHDPFAARAAHAGLLGALLGLIVFLALPLGIPGWSYLSPRILPPVAFAGFLFFRATSRAARVAQVLLLAGAALSFGVGALHATAEGEASYARAYPLADAPPGRTWSAMFGLHAELDPPPFAVTRGGLAGYAMLAGGAGPGIFAHDPVKDAMVFPDRVEALFPSPRAWWQQSDPCAHNPACTPPLPIADRIAREALPWDSLYLGDPPAAVVERIEARGYVRASAHTWRPRPARLRVQVPDPGPAVQGPLVVFWIWPGTEGVLLSERVAASDRRAGATWTAEAILPAGPGMLLVWIDTNENGVRDDDEPGWPPLEGRLTPGGEDVVPLPALGTPAP